MRRGNARLNLLQRPRIPGRWKCPNILQKGRFAAEIGTSNSSQRGDSPALFLLEYKAFLPAEFVRVSPNCLDHAPLTRSRADYTPAVRLRGFAWERENCLRADTRRGGPEDERHSVVWRKLELLEFSNRYQGLPSRAKKGATRSSFHNTLGL